MRTCGNKGNKYNDNYREQNSLNIFTQEVMTMALSNLSGWNHKNTASACGAGDKPTESPAACGAGDKPVETPAACGSACGAGDKPAETPSACGAGDR